MGEFYDVRSIDNLLFARKLVQFCPTSFSVDDLNENFTSHVLQRSHSEKVHFIPPNPLVSAFAVSPSLTSKSLSSSYNSASLISFSEQGQNSSSNLFHFNKNINSNSKETQPKTSVSRFDFLMNDIASIKSNSFSNKSLNCKENEKCIKKMKYELPNLRQLKLSGCSSSCLSVPRSRKPLMVVSLSSLDLEGDSHQIENCKPFNFDAIKDNNKRENILDNASYVDKVCKVTEGSEMFPEARHVDSPVPSGDESE
ncbi:hypothetical protein TRFO_17216 [Tritrichomonas foetus]|uniref:Uncharacterized protein n=1 Tax=Tritrichomonas foetus TaxID=1144522 RepID=A0A1J4KNM3_9EUKA|nr:hypothetical protein TRFO_17216 [Tritrichomonas foetus]|eukprot:OHT12843.1 hypothetical protein TRFO_17216 [Tritrichomonas foetus]